MNKIALPEIHLIGLSLPTKTKNENGQSAIDCGNLWQKFAKENYAQKIPNKLSEDVLAVYHQYDGDHNHPYSYFIGCKVEAGTHPPEGLDRLIIFKGPYQKIIASGKMPDCVANAWYEIWQTDIPRTYQTDFEVYDARSKEWNNAEVDIYLSVQQ